MSRPRTHGHTAGRANKPTRTYTAWVAMRQRCENPANVRYLAYGGRGIHVCDRWQDFAAFLHDMGECPPRASLDRIDNDGHYTPANCRWTTAKTQARNRRSNRMLTLNGETRCITEWAEHSGVDVDVIRQRIDTLKWAPERAVFTKERSYRKCQPQH